MGYIEIMLSRDTACTGSCVRRILEGETNQWASCRLLGAARYTWRSVYSRGSRGELTADSDGLTRKKNTVFSSLVKS